MRYDPPWPIPTADDSVVNGDEALLLEHAYSDSGFMSAFNLPLLRLFASQYGFSITPLPLRRAVLAYSARRLLAEQFPEVLEHQKVLAVRALSHSLRKGRIEENDAFAAWILMVASLSTAEISCHANGCLSMFAALANNPEARNPSALCAVIEPWLYETTRKAPLGANFEKKD